ncbi:hypothetical protein Tco_1514758, partial [Tanacetum coccineum]
EVIKHEVKNLDSHRRGLIADRDGLDTMRQVFPSYLNGQPITGIDIANMIVDQSFAQLYDDDAVSLCCLVILQLGYNSDGECCWSKKKEGFGHKVIPFFQRKIVPGCKIDTDDNEKLDRTCGFLGGPSSFQGHVNSSYFNMCTPPNFQTPMPSQPGSSDWQRQMLAQSATQYWQPDISSQPGSYYSFGQVPSHMGRPKLQTTN